MTGPSSLVDRLLFRAKMADYAFLVAVAVLIGCLGGVGAVLFRKLIALVQGWSWGDVTMKVELVRSHRWWWIVLTPALGGLVVGRRRAPDGGERVEIVPEPDMVVLRGDKLVLLARQGDLERLRRV